jgi:hypothetical protein
MFSADIVKHIFSPLLVLVSRLRHPAKCELLFYLSVALYPFCWALAPFVQFLDPLHFR